MHIAEWVSSSMHAYTVIEEPKLLEIFKILNPNFVPPSADTIKTDKFNSFSTKNML
jgi:hypothetical protein